MPHDVLCCPVCVRNMAVAALLNRPEYDPDEAYTTQENKAGPGRGRHEHGGGFTNISKGSWKDFEKSNPSDAKELKKKWRLAFRAMKKAGML